MPIGTIRWANDSAARCRSAVHTHLPYSRYRAMSMPLSGITGAGGGAAADGRRCCSSRWFTLRSEWVGAPHLMQQVLAAFMTAARYVIISARLTRARRRQLKPMAVAAASFFTIHHAAARARHARRLSCDWHGICRKARPLLLEILLTRYDDAHYFTYCCLTMAADG